jgi:tyrosine-specific transport protein
VLARVNLRRLPLRSETQHEHSHGPHYTNSFPPHAVGAGILALPVVTQGAGFCPSASLLVSSWAVLQLEALLIAEVNLQCHSEALVAPASEGIDPNRVIPLTEMTRMTLGATVEAAVTAVYLTMAFTLLLAYTARGGELLATSLPSPVPPALGPILFTSALGGTLALGGTDAAERVNSVLTAGMLVLFAIIVTNGATQVDWAHGLSHSDWGGAATCLPVMFLALVYHDLIPVVCQYLGFDRRKVTLSLFAGSILPLGMFAAWEAVCMGLVPFTTGTSIDPVDVLIQTQGPFGGTAIAAFSVAALSTSAIGTTLSLSNFFRNKLAEVTKRCVVEPPAVVKAHHTPRVRDCTALLLTLAPPTAAAMASTDIFLTATHLAGAYGMTLLYGLLPPALAWSARDSNSVGKQLLAGGKPVLLGLLGSAVAVEGLQLQLDLPGSQAGQFATAVVQPAYEVASAGESIMSLASTTASSFALSIVPSAVHVLPSL